MIAVNACPTAVSSKFISTLFIGASLMLSACSDSETSSSTERKKELESEMERVESELQKADSELEKAKKEAEESAAELAESEAHLAFWEDLDSTSDGAREARRSKDFLKARELYSRLCEIRTAQRCDELCQTVAGEGCGMLGYMYWAGEGGPKDLARARELYKLGCDGNAAVACENLGVVARFGQGGPRDFAVARAAFDKSCKLGNSKGCDRLKELDETEAMLDALNRRAPAPETAPGRGEQLGDIQAYLASIDVAALTNIQQRLTTLKRERRVRKANQWISGLFGMWLGQNFSKLPASQRGQRIGGSELECYLITPAEPNATFEHYALFVNPRTGLVYMIMAVHFADTMPNAKTRFFDYSRVMDQQWGPGYKKGDHIWMNDGQAVVNQQPLEFDGSIAYVCYVIGDSPPKLELLYR